jgi:hypothetical protein
MPRSVLNRLQAKDLPQPISAVMPILGTSFIQILLRPFEAFFRGWGDIKSLANHHHDFIEVAMRFVASHTVSPSTKCISTQGNVTSAGNILSIKDFRPNTRLVIIQIEPFRFRVV